MSEIVPTAGRTSASTGTFRRSRHSSHYLHHEQVLGDTKMAQRSRHSPLLRHRRSILTSITRASEYEPLFPPLHSSPRKLGKQEQIGEKDDLLDASIALTPLVENKKFVCTECGKCCTGSGEVWANDAEIEALTKFLGLRREHFERKYTKTFARRRGWYMLKRKQGSGDCVFLKNGTTCTVYGARPLQVHYSLYFLFYQSRRQSVYYAWPQ